MEQQLDTTFLRPGAVDRAIAIGLGAAGIGAGILLATWGISFLWRYTPPEIEVSVKQDEPFKVAQDKPFELAQPDPLKVDPAQVTVKLDQTTQPFVRGNAGETKTETGEVIRHEVTLFSSVDHGRGVVTTGWNYKDGRGGTPVSQYCYYTTPDSGGASKKIDLAFNESRLSAAAISLVPNLNEALFKCRWWKG